MRTFAYIDAKYSRLCCTPSYCTHQYYHSHSLFSLRKEYLANFLILPKKIAFWPSLPKILFLPYLHNHSPYNPPRPLQVLFHLSFPPLAQILLLHPVIALIILSCIFPWYRPSLVLHKSNNSLSPPLWRCYTDVWLQSKVFFHYRTWPIPSSIPLSCILSFVLAPSTPPTHSHSQPFSDNKSLQVHYQQQQEPPPPTSLVSLRGDVWAWNPRSLFHGHYLQKIALKALCTSFHLQLVLIF